MHCDFDSFYSTTQTSHQFYLGILNRVIETYITKLLKTKSEIFDIFQKFICQVESQSGKKFKYLYINFDKKFVNQAFEKYIAKKTVK